MPISSVSSEALCGTTIHPWLNAPNLCLWCGTELDCTQAAVILQGAKITGEWCHLRPARDSIRVESQQRQTRSGKKYTVRCYLWICMSRSPEHAQKLSCCQCSSNLRITVFLSLGLSDAFVAKSLKTNIVL